MIRLLFFIILIAVAGFGFAWLADTPGTLVMTVAGREVTVSLMVAAVALVAVVVAIMLVWWIIRVIITSPHRMQRFFRARRRDRGYQSLSTGIIAAGAGDAATARRMLKQANGLLEASSEPLIQLLEAQASLVEGEHDDARKKFEDMLGDPELRILGLRGLYMEAKRLGDREAARHYAEKAAEIAPHLSWAGTAALELKTAAGDWDGAIRLLDSQKHARQVTKDAAKRKRAVLLTALAMEQLEKDPVRAKASAVEAHKLAPGFAPAAVTAAQAALRLNDMRRGVNVLEQAWRKAPHPEVALAYVNARPGDSTHDRYKRARRLEQLKPNNTESSMIVAQMALEAGEYEEARKAVAMVLRNEPREGAFMLMADIEDAETGDQGKVREWLARAVRAPRDPAWTADGYVSETWAPVSPISGRLDAFEWKVPVERLGPVVENDLDPMVPGIAPVRPGKAAPAAAPAPQPEPTDNNRVGEAPEDDGGLYGKSPTEGEVLIPDPDEAATNRPPADVEEATVIEPAAKPAKSAPPEPAAAPAEAKSAAGAGSSGGGKAAPAKEPPAPRPSAKSETKPAGGEKSDKPAAPAAAKPADTASRASKPDGRQGSEEESRPPIPDDPGISEDDGEGAETNRRFRLF